MLCTIQYSFHCPSTLVFPRSVKRFRPLLARRLPNTGSTVAKRRVIIYRPMSPSIFIFILSASLGPPRLPCKNDTCRVFVLSGFCNKRNVRHAHEMGVARDDGNEMDVYGSFQAMRLTWFWRVIRAHGARYACFLASA